MKGDTRKAGGNGKQGKGGNNAPVTDNAANGTTVIAKTEGNGTEDGGNAGGNTTDEPEAGTGGAAQPDANANGGQPAANTETVVKKITKKAPPLKSGKRAGGGHTAHSGAPQYNIGICSYNDLVIDKNKELKYLPHILNGNWIPTYNGDPAGEVDDTLPKYDSLDAALAANAIQFGMKLGDKEMVKLYGYAQNIALAKGGYPLTGKVHSSDGKNYKAGDPVSYSCFITATAENAPQVIANMEAYLNSPYKAAVMFEVLPVADRKLTYPQVAAATLEAATANNAAK